MLTWMFGKDELASEKIEGNVQAKLKCLTEKANAGDVESQLELAGIYEGLNGVARNYTESRKWATAAANQDWPEGWRKLGIYHKDGLGGEKDPVQAEACFKKAFTLAKQLEEQDNPAIITTLGHLYLKGRGVEKNPAKALEYYKRAANKGYAPGQHNVGCMLDDFDDYSEDGIQNNPKEALRYYTLAAAQGHVPAGHYLAQLFHFGGKDFEVDLRQAREHYVFPASQGCAEAISNLGSMYLKGQGVTQDRKKGVRLLSLAAEQGFDHAQYTLGFVYKNADGVSRNFGTAREYFGKAADQGHAGAAFQLGRMYEIPQGGTQSMSVAFRYYKQAAEKDHVEALCHLGRVYESGYIWEGYTPALAADREKARECFEKAASFGNNEAQKALDRLNGVVPPAAGPSQGASGSGDRPGYFNGTPIAVIQGSQGQNGYNRLGNKR